MTYVKFIAAATLAAALAGPATAQMAMDLDGDADGMLSEQEFGTGFGSMDRMSQFDADGDGMLNSDEFTSYNYRRYDRDGSGMLEDTEFGDMDMDMGEGGLFGG